MKCVVACGLVAQCDEYQLGGNEKAVLTCALSSKTLLLYTLINIAQYYIYILC